MNSNHNGLVICNMCWPFLILYGDIFPNEDGSRGSDYVLAYRPTSEAPRADFDPVEPGEWPPGTWALHDIVDEQGHGPPIFAWGSRPVSNPFAGLDDETMDEVAEDDPRWDQDEELGRVAEEIEKVWDGDPTYGYYLVSACIKGGWPRKGFLANWLVDHLARLIERKEREWAEAGLPLGGNQDDEPDYEES